MKNVIKIVGSTFGIITVLVAVFSAVLLGVFAPIGNDFASALESVEDTVAQTVADDDTIGENLINNSAFTYGQPFEQYTTIDGVLDAPLNGGLAVFSGWSLSSVGSIAYYLPADKRFALETVNVNSNHLYLRSETGFFNSYIEAGKTYHVYCPILNAGARHALTMTVYGIHSFPYTYDNVEILATSLLTNINYPFDFSFTVPEDSQSDHFMIEFKCSSWFIPNFIKVEEGTAFTGYVPDTVSRENYNALKSKYESLQRDYKDLQKQNNTLQAQLKEAVGERDRIQNLYDTLLTSSQYVDAGSFYDLSLNYISSLDLNTPFSRYLTTTMNGSTTGYTYSQFYPYDKYSLKLRFNSPIPADDSVLLKWDMLCMLGISEDYFFDIYVYPLNSTSVADRVHVGTLNSSNFVNGSIKIVSSFEFTDIEILSTVRGESLSNKIFFSNARTYISSTDFYALINSSYDNGYANGVKVGESSGRVDGYNSGYTAGVKSAGEYTFFSLLSATVDAPLNTFKSMFNFEILGVNLAGFLLSLFSLAVILFVIKLLIGG